MKALLPALCLLPPALDAQAQSGPEPGMEIAPVQVYAATGVHRGKEFDLAEMIGKHPAAILFVNTVNRETAPPMRILDDLASDYRVLGFRSFTVRLHADRTAGEEEIKRFSNALKLRNPMVLSLDGAEGPGDYALHRRCTLTLVTFKDGKVKQSIGLTDTGAKDREMLQKAVAAVAGELPKSLDDRAKLLPADAAELKQLVVDQWREIARLRQQLANAQNRNRNRRMRDRSGSDQPRKPLPGAVPEDAELQGFMRQFNRAKTKDEVDALFQAVDKSVGDDPKRREMMTQGFIRLLATTYGTDHARTKAKAYVSKRRDATSPERRRRDR